LRQGVQSAWFRGATVALDRLILEKVRKFFARNRSLKAARDLYRRAGRESQLAEAPAAIVTEARAHIVATAPEEQEKDHENDY
jgi:hypothetical protein